MKRKYNKDLVRYARDLRNNMTLEEKRLWYGFLRTYPLPFSRQKILGNFIADFYCDKAKLIVELDGPTHYTEKGKEHDEERTDYLKRFGLKVIRINNLMVLHHFKDVCSYIDDVVNIRLEELGE